MALLHDAVGWSAVCDCGISLSYALAFVSYADNFCKQFGPKLNSKPFETMIVFFKEHFEKVNVEKSSPDNKRSMKYYRVQRVEVQLTPPYLHVQVVTQSISKNS